jgi:hypothetical protein
MTFYEPQFLKLMYILYALPISLSIFQAYLHIFRMEVHATLFYVFIINCTLYR